VEAFERLAAIVDGYRNFSLSNLELFEREISERGFGSDVLSAWKKACPALRRIETACRSIAGLETIWKTRSTAFVLAIMLVTATFIPTMMGVRNAWLFYGTFYSALSMLALSGVMSHLSSRRINTYLQQHGGKHSADMAIIKDFVQKLLNSLSRHFSEVRADPAKYPLELNNADYRGIRIIKRPGFRRTYQVIVESSS
jgi:hypothetical protein